MSTGLFAYLKFPSFSTPSTDLLVAVLYSSTNLLLVVQYSVVPPAVNSLIYFIRNQELKDAVRKLFEYMLQASICRHSSSTLLMCLQSFQDTDVF